MYPALHRKGNQVVTALAYRRQRRRGVTSWSPMVRNTFKTLIPVMACEEYNVKVIALSIMQLFIEGGGIRNIYRCSFLFSLFCVILQ